MNSDVLTHPPAGWFQHGKQVIALAAQAGDERRALLRSWLSEAAAGGAKTWSLACSFEYGGPWAGARDLFSSCIGEFGSTVPEILRRHDYELVRILPTLRKSLGTTRESLTEIAPPQERVRNYPADRAYRLVHGLVDLLFELKPFMQEESWVIACDDFDSAGAIALRFFVELVRRSARRLRLTLIIATGAGRGEEQLNLFPASISRLLFAPAVETAASLSTVLQDRELAARAATELEERVAAEPLEEEIHLPALIRFWLAAGRPDRALRWLTLGLESYNFMGVYEDSVIYGEQALRILKKECPDDTRLHWRIVAKLFMSYLALRRTEEALQFFTSEAPRERYEPFQRAQICYSLAMVYARYLPQRDPARGEELLAEGLRHLEQANAKPEDYYFQYVFNRNGLAMIRQFQGRPREAVALCREGYALLQEHLRPEAHRLHRSVLVYNMAQVYTVMGENDEAIAHFTAVIGMDPNYSEYHNERGNIYLRLGRLEEALADYQRAVTLSPPYPEVFTNLGQCHRKLGHMDLAVEAYSRALDLQPDVVLALLGRAQAFDALERAEEAIADYTAALELDQGLWEARLNRGILFYGQQRLVPCLADLDAAIRLAPDVAQLYQNRSLVLADLERHEEAIADLQEYMRREPQAEDRAEVLQRIDALMEGSTVA